MSQSHIFGMVIFACLTVDAELNVDYGKFQLKSKGNIPNTVPVVVASVPDVLTCSVKCSQDKLCLSFYYGNSKCGLFHGRELTLKQFSGYDYYNGNEAAATTPPVTVAMQETSPIPLATTTPPQVCSTCPYVSQQRFYIYRKSVFVICLDKLMWKTASDACSCVDGRLVNIPDNETQKFTEDMLSMEREMGTNLKEVWLGVSGKANGSNKPYTLRRSDGQNITRTSDHFTKWYPGEPDNNSEVGVGMIVDEGQNFGLWIDADKELPSEVRGYVCEFID